MLRNRNLYFFGISLIIISLLVIIPPKVNEAYSFLVFLFGVAFVFVSLKFLTRIIEVNKYLDSTKFFNYSDNEFLVLMLSIISISTVVYAIYIDYIIQTNGELIQSSNYPIKHTFKGILKYISESDYVALNFWNNALIILILTTFLISVVERYFRDRRI